MPQGKAIVFSNCTEGKDAEFNHWYDVIHAPEVIEKTPITRCTRMRLADDQIAPGTHRYIAIYEYDGETKAVQEALTGSVFEMSDTLQDPSIVFYESMER